MSPPLAKMAAYRQRPLALLTAALLAGSTPALAAPAADSQQAELLKLLEKMNSRLEKLEKRNAELEKQLSVAPASTAAPASMASNHSSKVRQARGVIAARAVRFKIHGADETGPLVDLGGRLRHPALPSRRRLSGAAVKPWRRSDDETTGQDVPQPCSPHIPLGEAIFL